jgi:hypothetical protein
MAAYAWVFPGRRRIPVRPSADPDGVSWAPGFRWPQSNALWRLNCALAGPPQLPTDPERRKTRAELSGPEDPGRIIRAELSGPKRQEQFRVQLRAFLLY